MNQSRQLKLRVRIYTIPGTGAMSIPNYHYEGNNPDMMELIC